MHNHRCLGIIDMRFFRMYGRVRSLTRVLLVFTLCVFGACAQEEQIYTTVNTDVGTFKGKVEDIESPFLSESKSIASFLGIPYAKAPVGDLRFAKPIPMEKMNVTFDATDFGPMCPQDSFINKLPKQFPTSEDCLYLNVFAPKDTSDRKSTSRPVLVYLHGGFGMGDYRDGGSNYYPGDVLAAYGSVIVVTLNYRLGLFGFFNVKYKKYDNEPEPETIPGNYGLWDQHLALKWIHNNIDKFGGDSSKVTLIGQQTGAVCALYQAMYPGNRGLFHRVIAQSGTPFASAAPYVGPFVTKPSSVRAYEYICLNFNAAEDLQCMRNKTFDDVMRQTFVMLGSHSLTPVYDGEFLKADPNEMINPKNSKYKKVQDFFGSLDMIVGYNTMDGLSHVQHLWELKLASYEKYVLGKDPGEDAFDPNIFKVNEVMFEIAVNHTLTNEILDRVILKADDEDLRKLIFDRYLNIVDPDDNRDLLLQFSTDYVYKMPVINLVNARKQLLEHISTKGDDLESGTLGTYLYTFSAQPGFKFRTKPTPIWAKEANNGDELPFLFGFSRKMLDALNVSSSYQPSKDELDLSRILMDKWKQFATHGYPHADVLPESPVWPSCFQVNMKSIDANIDIENITYFEFSNGMNISNAVRHRYGYPAVPFWNSLKPYFDGTTKMNSDVSTICKGTIFGMEASSSETLVLILIVVIIILVISLLVASACFCRNRSRTLTYEGCEMKA